MKALIIPIAHHEPRDTAIENIILLGTCASSLEEIAPAVLASFEVRDPQNHIITTKVALARVIMALARVIDKMEDTE